MKIRHLTKILIILLAIIMLASTTYATDEVLTEELPQETTEEVPQLVEQVNDTVIVKAKVIKADEPHDEIVMEYTSKYQNVTVEILEGEFAGNTYEGKYCLSYDIDNKIQGYPVSKGNKVFVQIVKDSLTGEPTITVQDMVRENYLLAIIILFFAIILVVGRKQGLKAIVALIVTIVAIFTIMLNAIFKGYSAIWVSVGTSALIIVVTFIIISGINKKSITAALGTTGGVLCAGIIASIFGVLAKLSGAGETAIYLTMSTQDITFNLRELLFAGIVITALGACMDVGMSIASALDELKQKNQDMGMKELLKSGMNIGRDIIGTMTNTLILAYVGGEISLILLFMVGDMSFTEIINKEMIVTDAISAIAASMGVIFTVPITSAIYAVFNRNPNEKKDKNIKINGQRSLKI